MKAFNGYVFCDFDGTLTYKNSLSYIILKKEGFFPWIKGILLLLPYFFLFKIKMIKNDKMSFKFFNTYFSKYKQNDLNNYFSDSDIYLDDIIKEYVLEFLKNLQNERKFKIIIVSASSSLWLEKWCSKYNFEHVTSELSFDEDMLPLKYNKYCWGKNKVSFILNKYNIQNKFIITFGDTKGDKEMLKLGSINLYKPTYLEIQKTYELL
jgi:HAD superfamily phosphoserine phosphatase-like hydrolase